MHNPIDTANDVAVPGLLRPPFVLLAAIILGVILNLIWPVAFLPSALVLAGPIVVFAAALLFVLSLREFRAAGTSVRGNERSAAVVCSGPYRFSRNPIYLAFVLFLLGLALWLRNVWLLLSAAGFASFVSIMVIPREERFLERNFPVQYSGYRSTVRRWI
ncbi:MAG TPA: isoprenylcysteine carboxylmethyltransferase family protein [Candidatus Acidoferrales bacterium]|nr:isoprenylcysteine carboxylmethyltransferase family protein [Candidatus Acidoferrales bacterium]